MFRKTTLLWPTITRTVHRMKPTKQAGDMHRQPRSSANKSVFYTTLASEAPLPAPPPKVSLPWEKYRELVESNTEISAEKLEALAKQLLIGKNNRPSVVIGQMQDILKYMSSRQASHPDIKASFPTCCNYLIRAYVQLGDMKTARLVFDRMVALGDSNGQSMREIVSGLRSLGTRAEIYEFQKSMESKGLWGDDSLLYCEMIYALSDHRDVPGCRFYFAEMKSKGLATSTHAYRAILSVYKNALLPQQVLKYFNEMQKEGIQPTLKEYGILFYSLSKDKDYNALLVKTFEEIKSRGLGIQMNFYLAMGWDPLKALQEMEASHFKISVRDCNASLSYYIKKNRFSDALTVIKWISERKMKLDMFSYGIMIDALAKDAYTAPEVAFDLYEEMKRQNIQPDLVCFTSLITNCCKQQDLDKALSMLSEMQTYELKPNIYTFNSILNVVASMAKTSSIDVERASLIWSKMTDLGIQPDTRTCNIYLSLLSRLVKPIDIQHDESEGRLSQQTLWGELEDTNHHVSPTVKEMQKLYRYMRRHKLESMHPDFITYSIVINAMSSAGEVRSAMQVYDDAKMSRVTLPVPAYNEMMNALQRCGRVSESMGIWHDMKLLSILPDSTTYTIVLENCEQLGLVDSIESIRRRRKLDFDRLQEVERAKETRRLERLYKKQ